MFNLIRNGGVFYLTTIYLYVMDIKFLDKIVDQIVSETTVDYKRDRIYSPFTSPSFISHIYYGASTSFSRYFIKHCKDVYGLKDSEEIDYVLDKFKVKMKEFVESSGVLNQPNTPTF